jgi:hypothetical protein
MKKGPPKIRVGDPAGTYQGAPCKHCENRSRWVRNGQCTACKKDRNRAWAKANPERIARIARRARLKLSYGITEEAFEALLIAQQGRCCICETPMPEPHIDHSHAKGHVRGLLCRPCNKGLGHFRDDPVRMRSAAAYINERE